MERGGRPEQSEEQIRLVEIDQKKASLKALYSSLEELNKTPKERRDYREVGAIQNLLLQIESIKGGLKNITTEREYENVMKAINTYNAHSNPDADKITDISIDGENITLEDE